MELLSSVKRKTRVRGGSWIVLVSRRKDGVATFALGLDNLAMSVQAENTQQTLLCTAQPGLRGSPLLVLFFSEIRSKVIGGEVFGNSARFLEGTEGCLKLLNVNLFFKTFYLFIYVNLCCGTRDL